MENRGRDSSPDIGRAQIGRPTTWIAVSCCSRRWHHSRSSSSSCLVSSFLILTPLENSFKRQTLCSWYYDGELINGKVSEIIRILRGKFYDLLQMILFQISCFFRYKWNRCLTFSHFLYKGVSSTYFFGLLIGKVRKSIYRSEFSIPQRPIAPSSGKLCGNLSIE